MPIRIDWAHARDAGAVTPLLRHLYAHDAPERAEPTEAEAQAHFARLLAPDVPHKLAIAWDEAGQAVGLAALGIFQSVADFRLPQGRQMELKELFVHPDHRNAGVGAALMAWMTDYAKTMGVGRIDWHVDESNARGQAFYQRHGARFVPYRLSMRKQLAEL